MICANVPSPNVSSDDSSTEANDDQSDPEAIKVGTSTTSTSLPLGHGSLFYQNLARSPSPPLARGSSTTNLLLNMSYEVAPLIPAAPLLPKFSPRRPSVISCPAGTCDEQFIAINPSPVNDVSLNHHDDVIDHISIGNNSLEVVPVHQQDEETVPVPPPPNTDNKDRNQRGLDLCIIILEKERMLGLSQDRRKTRRRTQRRIPRRRWRTQRTGVRQTHYSSFQIVLMLH